MGTDIVCIPEFAAQLAQPGSRFEAVFSPAELRVAARKGGRRAEHLAGRWAAKESFIKAWSQAIYGRPPAIAEERVSWSEVEIRPDAWGRVDIATSGQIRAQVAATLGVVETSVSISHDGDYATATTIISYD